MGEEAAAGSAAPESDIPQPRKRRWGVWGAVGFLPFVGIVFTAWALTATGPAPEAEYALVPGAGVDIVQSEVGYEFSPTSAEPQAGVIIYPGGRIDPESYATLARDIVEAEDLLVVITPMTLNLAMLSDDKAAEVLAAYPEIDTWILAGHSLGGVGAATYVDENPGAVDALMLMGAYPAESTDLSGADTLVFSVTASEDTVMNAEAYEAAIPRLPAGTTFVEIEGGNHAQFGSYGEQPNDSPATISAEEQRAEVIDSLRSMFGAIETP